MNKKRLKVIKKKKDKESIEELNRLLWVKSLEDKFLR